MAFINWTNQYSVGVLEIDNQHKELVKLLNDLFDAMSIGKANDVLGRIIDQMVSYALIHFETEEHYFDEFGFEGAEDHKLEHQEFVEKVAHFKVGFDAGNIILSMEVFRFLKDWLSTHMLGSDQKYKQCFQDNGLI